MPPKRGAEGAKFFFSFTAVKGAVSPEGERNDPAEVTKTMGRAPQAPQFFFSFTAAEGAVPSEGKRNPNEGGCFASIYICTPGVKS